MSKNKILTYATFAGLILFGITTLFLSTSIIFNWFGIRTQQGNNVPLVVRSNFLSGVLYLISVFGLWAHKKWTIVPLLISFFVLIGAFLGLYVHVNSGGLYETKTIGALFFRIIVTMIFALLAYLITIKWKY